MDIRLDEGFLFGLGAFETIAVEKGKPILFEKHIERLEKAADFLQLGSCIARGLSKEKVISYLAEQEPEMTFRPPLIAAAAPEGALRVNVPPSTVTLPLTVPFVSVRLSVASMLPLML